MSEIIINQLFQGPLDASHDKNYLEENKIQCIVSYGEFSFQRKDINVKCLQPCRELALTKADEVGSYFIQPWNENIHSHLVLPAKEGSDKKMTIRTFERFCNFMDNAREQKQATLT